MSQIASLFTPMTPVEIRATSGKIVEKNGEKATPFHVPTTAEMTQPDPANFAGGAGSATANTLFAAQDIGQKPAESEKLDEKFALGEPTAEDLFRDFMNKTPDEMMREAILKELGYTEEGLAGMDAKERAKVEEKIRQMTQEMIEEQMREEGIDVQLSDAPLQGASYVSLMTA